MWWRLRDGLDAYIEPAEVQIAAFSAAFDALADYQQYSAGFSDLFAKYKGVALLFLLICSLSHWPLSVWR